MKKNQILVVIILGSALMLPLAVGAQTTSGGTNLPAPGIHRTVNRGFHQKTANRTVAGTVASISGTTLTITDKKGTAYTVDASAAKLVLAMNDPSIVITSIRTGDKIFATGTITGANVAAKIIRDQSFVGRIIFNGKVTAVNGNAITISFRKTPYTIDASSAAITSGTGKNAKTITPSGIKVGDMVTAVGTLSGTTITAASIRDVTPKKHGVRPMKNKTRTKTKTSGNAR